MKSTEDRILFVEDDKDTRFILSKLLEKHGFVVETAENGSTALKILKKYEPKLVIADWTMPEMDGIKLCDIMKKDDKYKSIYFIMLTARASLEDKVTGLDVGADEFLIKPVQNQELLARIRSGIRIFNLQAELKSIEQNKAVLNLACTIGHKINNPLSSLILSLKNLEEDLTKQSPQNFTDDFSIINESVERIRGFVDALQKIDKPEFVEYALENKMLKLK